MALPKDGQRPEIEYEPRVLGSLSRASTQIAAVQLEALRSRCIGIGASQPLPRHVRVIHTAVLALQAEQRAE